MPHISANRRLWKTIFPSSSTTRRPSVVASSVARRIASHRSESLGLMGSSPGASRPDEQNPGLGHLLDRISHAFAPESRSLHASVGKVVDAKARRVVDD